ncbi:Type 1 glutamine amidotransferase-like domain-containing protein [Actinomadura sp. K4S16]|uniref:Type 1 glutamine amidotransferase-like domain-containing protein n=1 Tax=Actinomadura sp. K4S16 TaxID=1316147 RepID=UPI00135CE059|nr:Type 1 glutamine amidotransferase-like domain-containing protein [Actinomadura sp. K4S16]
MPAWLGSLPDVPRRAVLVPTAANPLPSAPFVRAAADLLKAEGLAVDVLDLERAAGGDVRRMLDGARVVFVTGGYPVFLLEHVRRSGFDRVAVPAVADGSLAYVGISAGAALAGPDLRPLQAADDPGTVDSTAGLGLVPFVVLPHRNRGRAARHDRLAREPGRTGRVLSINDDQAVSVTGDGFEILESGCSA